jgi:hypothetical protein
MKMKEFVVLLLMSAFIFIDSGYSEEDRQSFNLPVYLQQSDSGGMLQEFQKSYDFSSHIKGSSSLVKQTGNLKGKIAQTTINKNGAAEDVLSRSGLKQIGSHFMKYSLLVGGVGASASIYDHYGKTGEVDCSKALDFLEQSGFIRSALSIFTGTALFNVVGNLLPPGVGSFFKALPGFMGASLGQEWAINGFENTDWTKMLITNVVGCGVFATLGAGGMVAIAGSIVASLAADKLYDQIVLGKEPSSIEELTPEEIRTRWPTESKQFSSEISDKTHAGLQQKYYQSETVKEIQRQAESGNLSKARSLLQKLQKQSN